MRQCALEGKSAPRVRPIGTYIEKCGPMRNVGFGEADTQKRGTPIVRHTMPALAGL